MHLAVCNNNIRAKIELQSKIIEKVSEFKYKWTIISNYNTDTDLEYRIQTFRKANSVFRRSTGKQMT